MDYKTCPNCNKKLAGFISGDKYIIGQKEIDFVNSFNPVKSEVYCSGCASDLINEHRKNITTRKSDLTNNIYSKIDIIPIITSHTPLNWDYKTIGMVNAQSVSGTGFLTELASSWSDFTGGQSLLMSNKISSGENICKTRLRFECIKLGGNAIIATDIDYSEVGGGKGMIMVCMSGTAVNLDITNDIFNGKNDDIIELSSNSQELYMISKIKFPMIQ